MNPAAVKPTTCTRCGETVPPNALLMDADGAIICPECLDKREAQEGLRKYTKNVMLAPAMAAALAYFAFLVPVLGLVAPAVLAAIAILGAIGGIRLHSELARRTDDHGVSSGLRTGLLVMSILTIVFAAFPLLIQVLGWIGLALL
jgi:hypothetical protein